MGPWLWRQGEPTITSATAYGVICAGTTSTGAFQVVTPGTAGYLLESGGSSALPTWVSVGGAGNFVLIQSQTLTNSTSQYYFTSGINSTYNNYFLLFSAVSNLYDTQSIYSYITISTNGGSSYIASGYRSVDGYVSSNSTTWTSASGGTQVLINFALPISSSSILNGGIYLYNLTSGSGYVSASCKAVCADTTATNTTYQIGAGQYETASTTVNAIAITFPSPLSSFSGTISLFGILE